MSKNSKKSVHREAYRLPNVVDFKILSCDRDRMAVIEFYYNGCKYNETVKYRNISRSMVAFSIKDDGIFVEYETRGKLRTPDEEHLNKRKSDLLSYTDELKTKLIDFVTANPLNKYAAFLYYAINTEELSVAAKSNSELYADKTESLLELMSVVKSLNYKLHIIQDNALSWKFKLLIIVLDDGTHLAYHFKDIKADYTNDFDWDGSPFNFTESLIEKIKELV